MLKYDDLLVIVEHVKNDSPSLRVYLQKTSLIQKVEQETEQQLGSKAYLQKVKMEHVEKGLTTNVQVEIVDQIYNQRFQKYLDD